MTAKNQISGKIDTKLDQESTVVSEIESTLSKRGAGGYLCTYGDDPAGNLAIKVEHGDAMQTVVVEVHAWPRSIRERLIQELTI